MRVNLDVDKLPNLSDGTAALRCSGFLVPISLAIDRDGLIVFACERHGIWSGMAAHDGFPVIIQWEKP